MRDTVTLKNWGGPEVQGGQSADRLRLRWGAAPPSVTWTCQSPTLCEARVQLKAGGPAAREGSGPMAEAAQPSGESQGAEVTIQIQQPTERALKTPVRRGPRSVLRVSQLLLRAIAGHPRLTLAALKKELGNAGYEVRRKISRHVGESTRSEKGTLLRVSGSDAAGYFRVWRAPKPRRKGGRSRLTLGRRSSRRTLPRSPRPRRPRSRRKAAKKAREVWRRKAKVSKAKPRGTRSTARSRVRSRTRSRARSRARSVAKSRATDQVCARAKEQACARAREQARARSRAQDCAKAKEEECAKAREQACTGAREEARVRATDNSKVKPSGEDAKPQPKDERRPSSKSRDEKRQEPEKLVKRSAQKPAVAKADSASSSGQGKARTKSSTKSEGPGCSGNS